MKRVLSWGLGLQSTLLAVMSAKGDLPPLDLIINADLHFESSETYRIRDFYIEWLRSRGQNVVILDVGNIEEKGMSEHMHVPVFCENGSPLRRQCTGHFKIAPIRRYVRQWLGYTPRPPHPPPNSIEQWIGFTIDEWMRMKSSGVKYIKNRFPLIEKRMTRDDCLQAFAKYGLPAPGKSACLCCPYRTAEEWQTMRDNFPDDFQRAVRFDNSCRNKDIPGARHNKFFILSDCIPLETAEFEVKKRSRNIQLPLFNSACDSGYCFV